MADPKSASRPRAAPETLIRAMPETLNRAAPETLIRAAPAGAAPGPGAPAVEMLGELKVTAHLMSLPPGLFCILHEPASGQRAGLPAIRISLPPEPGGAVQIAGFRPDGWLGAGGDAVLVRVTEGASPVLVTIYQSPNEPAEAAPKLQVRQILGGGEARPAAPAPQPGAPERLDVLAHLQGSGDRGAKFGGWVGERGGGQWIEGFAIAPLEGFEPGDLSYQAVLGRGWLSPWVEAGQYCGSRGMALPLLGFRIRLQGAAAEAFELSASASFVDGTRCGPVGSDATCEGASLAPLEAMSITLTPRARKPARGRR